MSRVQSIERAFAVLGALADGPIGVTEVADRADLPKSTAARLLARWPAKARSSRSRATTRYRLGPRLVTLAAGFGRPVAVGARPAVARRSWPSRPARPPAWRPRRGPRPLHRSGGHAESRLGPRLDGHADPAPRGVVRAGAPRLPPPAVVKRYLGRPLERFTPRTLVTADALRERLREIRRDGYAWALEEFDEGISSVAAPIADASGEVVAAVHLHGPSYRFPERARRGCLRGVCRGCGGKYLGESLRGWVVQAEGVAGARQRSRL